jgi:Leucine-rich repeat (LRR) protein
MMNLNISTEPRRNIHVQVDLSHNAIRGFKKTMYKLHVDVDLSYNRMKKLPTPKMKVPGIHKLDVSNNVISQLPPLVNNLLCMTRLDLSHNKIDVVSNDLGVTKYIRWLDLSYNEITALPDEFCYLGYALSEFYVTHNRLSTFPETIQMLKVFTLMV